MRSSPLLLPLDPWMLPAYEQQVVVPIETALRMRRFLDSTRLDAALRLGEMRSRKEEWSLALALDRQAVADFSCPVLPAGINY